MIPTCHLPAICIQPEQSLRQVLICWATESKMESRLERNSCRVARPFFRLDTRGKPRHLEAAELAPGLARLTGAFGQ